MAVRAVPVTPAPFPWAEDFVTVGVTGTNGKTSTTMLVAHAIRASGHGVVGETTLGFHRDGVLCEEERSLRGFYAVARKAAEAGVRHAALEITSLALSRGFARRWRVEIGVFTNLTRDHLDAHGSFEHYLASKAQMFLYLSPSGCAVFNAADPSAALLHHVTPSEVRRLWYAVPSRGQPVSEPDLAAASVEVDDQGTHLRLAPSPLADELGGHLSTRLVGEVFAENALAAACAAHAAGIPGAAIVAGLAACPGVPGRFEIVHRKPIIAIDYAHTPDALARTCDTARHLSPDGRLIVVFGAGGGRDQGKRPEMGAAVSTRANAIILTSDNPRNEPAAAIAEAIRAGCQGDASVEFEPDRRKAIGRAICLARANDVVVIAGKGHEQGQTIGEVTLPFSDQAVVSEIVVQHDGIGGPSADRL